MTSGQSPYIMDSVYMEFVYFWLLLSIPSILMAVVFAFIMKAYHKYFKTKIFGLAVSFGLVCIFGTLVFLYFDFFPFFLYWGCFVLYYHLYIIKNPDSKRVPSYTLLWCVTFAFLFTPIVMFSMYGLKVISSTFAFWQVLNALSFLAVISAHLAAKSIYPKWLQENW